MVQTGSVHTIYFGKHCIPLVTVFDTIVIELPRPSFKPLINCVTFQFPPSKTLNSQHKKLSAKLSTSWVHHYVFSPLLKTILVRLLVSGTYGNSKKHLVPTKEFHISLRYIASCLRSALLQSAHLERSYRLNRPLYFTRPLKTCCLARYHLWIPVTHCRQAEHF